MRNPSRTTSYTDSNPNPTPKHIIPVPKYLSMNFPTISPTMPTVPVRVQKVTIVSPTRPPVQAQRVPLKYSEGTTISVIKAMPSWPIRPSLKTWRHDPRLQRNRAAEVSQLVIQEHLNHIYHPVIGQCETYYKLNILHSKRWITSMPNDLGRLAPGVGDRITSGIDTIFLSTIIKSQQEGRQHIIMQSVIKGH